MNKRIPKVSRAEMHDLGEIEKIEQASFTNSYAPHELRNMLKCASYRMITHEQFRISGFLFAAKHENRISIMNMAIDPELRRRGSGRAMIDTLKSHLTRERDGRITAKVVDHNLDAHLFFQSLGFECVCVLREHYDTGEDAYVFQYPATMRRKPAVAKCVNAWRPGNRITGLVKL